MSIRRPRKRSYMRDLLSCIKKQNNGREEVLFDINLCLKSLTQYLLTGTNKYMKREKTMAKGQKIESIKIV